MISTKTTILSTLITATQLTDMSHHDTGPYAMTGGEYFRMNENQWKIEATSLVSICYENAQ